MNGFRYALVLAFALAGAAVRAEDDTFPDGDIFGFTDPTDVGEVGDRGLSFETTTRIGKRAGRYLATTLKSEVSVTPVENLEFALASYASWHRIRGVPGLSDRAQGRFDGFSGEVAWRFLPREAGRGIAATLAFEPRVNLVDGTSGERVIGYGAELKLYLDAPLGRDFYGALNLTYEFGTQASFDPLAPGWEQDSGLGLSGALARKLTDDLFIGLEARYLTAFSGAALNDFDGHALMFGPNLYYRIPTRDPKISAAVNLAWTPQIAGRAVGGPRGRDLDNFERHELRAKLSIGF